MNTLRNVKVYQGMNISILQFQTELVREDPLKWTLFSTEKSIQKWTSDFL